jgi:hypothetical protein
MKKYSIEIVDVENFNGEDFYTFNVYKRFLFIFWRSVFTISGTNKQHCHNQCKLFVEQNCKVK